MATTAHIAMQNLINKTKLPNFIDNFAYNKYNKNTNASQVTVWQNYKQ